MTDENAKAAAEDKGGEDKEKETPQTDVFGNPTNEGSDENQGGEEEDKGQQKTSEEQLAEERESRIRLEEQSKTKDENIREMRKSMKSMQDQLQQLQSGQGGNEGGENKGGEQQTELFKEVKTSKDLTAEEKEEMTDTEVKQYDEIAALKTGMNQLANLIQQAGADNKGGGEQQKGTEQVDASQTVQDRALELAGDDTETANQIIEKFKTLNFNTEGLSAEDIKQRVDIAAKSLPDYQPPKEQKSTKGNAVKGGGSSQDPHGVDKIVEEATADSGQPYDL